MKKAIWKSGLGFVLLLSITFTARLHAADFTVVIDDTDKFKPATVQIQYGDTITWENRDFTFFPHSTTSDQYYWNGALYEPYDTYSVTFNVTGTFPYYDQGSSATGTITVVAANTPITLSAFKVLGGKFQFDIDGLTVGKTNYVQASTNFTNWTSLRTNVATASTSSFTNTSPATLNAQFYRVKQLP